MRPVATLSGGKRCNPPLRLTVGTGDRARISGGGAVDNARARVKDAFSHSIRSPCAKHQGSSKVRPAVLPSGSDC